MARGHLGQGDSLLQQELDLWGPRTLKGAISAYFRFRTDGLAEGTLNDYRERADWLLDAFGESCPIDRLTFDALHETCWRSRDELANVTLKRRMDLLRWALVLAHARGYLEPANDRRTPLRIRYP